MISRPHFEKRLLADFHYRNSVTGAHIRRRGKPYSASSQATSTPLNAQSVQDDLVSQGQAASVQHDPVGITNHLIAGDTPRLMSGGTKAVITDWALRMLVAMS